MQQIIHTINTLSDWRRFLRTFAGSIYVSLNDQQFQIRRQHAMAAFVFEAARCRAPRVDVGADRVVIHITQRTNLVPA